MANDLYIRTLCDRFKLVGSYATPDLARAEGMKLVGYGNYYLERESVTRRASKQRTKATIKSSRISADELEKLFNQL